jgi:hypothetical protein
MIHSSKQAVVVQLCLIKTWKLPIGEHHDQEGRQVAYTDRPMRRTPFGAPDFQSMADDKLLVVFVPS